jgi:alpha-tubulin suppressor-like RCC1 family protein
MTGVQWAAWFAIVLGVGVACGGDGSDDSDDGSGGGDEAGGPGNGVGGTAGKGSPSAGAGAEDAEGGSTFSGGTTSAGAATSAGGSGGSAGSTGVGGASGSNTGGSASGGIAGSSSGEGGASGDAGGSAGAGGTAGSGGSAGCVLGDTRSCAEDGLLGSCAAGVKTCDGEGGFGECSILPADADTCTAGLDEDCDGIPNEGCSCTDGALQGCGPATGSGICERGVSTCVGGQWSACENAVYARTRDCASADDNDCDGSPDNTLDTDCECAPGATAACDEHSQDGVGVCRAGTLTCYASGNGSSSAYGACVGAVGPGTELCANDGLDEDCDGTVNEAVVCEAVVGVDIAAGVSHSCVLLSNGTARCWGYNGWNELGAQNGTSSSVPIVAAGVAGSNRGTSIDASNQHNCVVTREARAYCWGKDDYDQLGKRFTSADVIGIGAGNEHTCALVYPGTVRCWGRGGSGRLGNSTPWFDEWSWVTVNNVTTATALAVGHTHACAALVDGTVRCWGDNSSGQVGDDSGLSAVDSGELVVDVAGAIGVAAGGAHSCALLSNGTVKCWGDNSLGQLGDGTNMSQPVAVPVLGLTAAVAIDAGHSHTCAVLEDGTARCWGSNGAGELGDGTAEERANPVVVEGLEGVRAIAAGGSHTCAVLDNGRVYCWGYNYHGQLGDGTELASAEPVEVLLP